MTEREQIDLPPATVYVLLTSYNRRPYLPVALESVLAQTYRDFHVLVIDDGSEDGSAELAHEYHERQPDKVTAVCKGTRRGIGDTLNLGLRTLRSAPYFALLNEDDVWHPTKLEAQLEVFSPRPDVGLVATDALIIGPDGSPTGQVFSEFPGPPDTDRLAQRIFWYGNCLVASSVMLSHEAVGLIGELPRGGMAHDLVMWLEVASQLSAVWIPEPLVSYRMNHEQLTSTHARASRREVFKLRRDLLERSPAVCRAVGGDAARRRLDGDALYWAAWHLRHRDWDLYRWFTRQVLARRKMRLDAWLVYLTIRSLLGVASDAVTRGGREGADYTDRSASR